MMVIVITMMTLALVDTIRPAVDPKCQSIVYEGHIIRISPLWMQTCHCIHAAWYMYIVTTKSKP